MALADDAVTLLVGAYNVDLKGAAYLFTGEESGGGGGGALSMAGLIFMVWAVRRRKAGCGRGQTSF